MPDITAQHEQLSQRKQSAQLNYDRLSRLAAEAAENRIEAEGHLKRAAAASETAKRLSSEYSLWARDARTILSRAEEAYEAFFEPLDKAE